MRAASRRREGSRPRDPPFPKPTTYPDQGPKIHRWLREYLPGARGRAPPGQGPAFHLSPLTFHPFHALNACLFRACREAQGRPLRRAKCLLRAGVHARLRRVDIRMSKIVAFIEKRLAIMTGASIRKTIAQVQLSWVTLTFAIPLESIHGQVR